MLLLSSRVLRNCCPIGERTVRSPGFQFRCRRRCAFFFRCACVCVCEPCCSAAHARAMCTSGCRGGKKWRDLLFSADKDGYTARLSRALCHPATSRPSLGIPSPRCTLKKSGTLAPSARTLAQTPRLGAFSVMCAARRCRAGQVSANVRSAHRHNISHRRRRRRRCCRRRRRFGRFWCVFRWSCVTHGTSFARNGACNNTHKNTPT